jgi:hypothetical protein
MRKVTVDEEDSGIIATYGFYGLRQFRRCEARKLHWLTIKLYKKQKKTKVTKCLNLII